jgi:hypothetical protein
MARLTLAPNHKVWFFSACFLAGEGAGCMLPMRNVKRRWPTRSNSHCNAHTSCRRTLSKASASKKRSYRCARKFARFLIKKPILL